MFYSIVDRENLGKLEELASLQNQVNEVQLPDKLKKTSISL